MASPAKTARGVPVGIPIKDGYQALIAFTVNPTVSFWEKSVKPPGINGGDKIPQTTMHNTAWRTYRSRSLRDLTPVTGKAAYDPSVMNDIIALVNVETSITVYWRDGSAVSFYGYLKEVEFDDLQEGTQPELSYTVEPTNYDPVNHLEVGPVPTPVAGT